MTYFPDIKQETIDKAFEKTKLEVEQMIKWKFLIFHFRLAKNRGLFDPPKQRVIGYIKTPYSYKPVIVPHPCAV